MTKDQKRTLSSTNQNEAALHQETVSSSAKLQLSCLVAAAEILWVLCREQRAAVVFSGVRRFTQWSVNVFQSVLNVWVSCVSLLRDILRPVFLKISGSYAWKRLKGVQLSEPNTDRVCQCDFIWMLKINISQNSKRKKNLAIFHKNHHLGNKHGIQHFAGSNSRLSNMDKISINISIVSKFKSPWKSHKCHPFCHPTAAKSVNLGQQPRVQRLPDAQEWDAHRVISLWTQPIF